MVLTRCLMPVAFAGLLAVGCADPGFEVSEEGAALPATLEEMLPSATSFARSWEGDAYLTGMGGGYTITDAEGRGYAHSFRFHGSASQRDLDVHLFAGSPWGGERSARTSRPAALAEVAEPRVSSDAALAAARDEVAASYPATEEPQAYSVRLLSRAVWPEGTSPGSSPDRIAWRVDYLEERPSGGGLLWWSLLRVYVDPGTGEVLGVVREEGLYPDP